MIYKTNKIGSRWIDAPPDYTCIPRACDKKLITASNAEPPVVNLSFLIGRSINPSGKERGENMKEKDERMFEETVEILKKLDRESLVILRVSIEMLAARQQMDENKPKTPAA